MSGDIIATSASTLLLQVQPVQADTDLVDEHPLGRGTSDESLVEEKNEAGSAPIATSGNSVYISWPSNITDRFEIMFRASLDNGKTFGPEST